MKKEIDIVAVVVAILLTLVFFIFILSLFAPSQVSISQDDAKKAMEAAKKVSEALED